MSLPIPAAVSVAACRGLQDGCWYRTSHAGSISYFPAHALTQGSPPVKAQLRLNNTLAHSPPTDLNQSNSHVSPVKKIIIPGNQLRLVINFDWFVS